LPFIASSKDTSILYSKSEPLLGWFCDLEPQPKISPNTSPKISLKDPPWNPPF